MSETTPVNLWISIGEMSDHCSRKGNTMHCPVCDIEHSGSNWLCPEHYPKWQKLAEAKGWLSDDDQYLSWVNNQIRGALALQCICAECLTRFEGSDYLCPECRNVHG